MDPTSAVARTEHLVLFSRLGPSYRPAALERALWTDRTLFEYRAFILPVDDLPHPQGDDAELPAAHRVRAAHLGPAVPRGQRVVPSAHPAPAARRRAAARPRPREPNGARVAHRRLERRRRQRRHDARGVVGARRRDDRRSRGSTACGTWRRAGSRWTCRSCRRSARPRGGPPPARRRRDREARRIGWLFDGLQADGWQRALAGFVQDGTAVEVGVEGVKGAWIADAAALEAPFRGRSVALSPFDRLSTTVRVSRPCGGSSTGSRSTSRRRSAMGVLRAAGPARGPAGGPVRPPVRARHADVAHNAVHAEDDPRTGDADAVRRIDR